MSILRSFAQQSCKCFASLAAALGECAQHNSVCNHSWQPWLAVQEPHLSGSSGKISSTRIHAAGRVSEIRDVISLQQVGNEKKGLVKNKFFPLEFGGSHTSWCIVLRALIWLSQRARASHIAW